MREPSKKNVFKWKKRREIHGGREEKKEGEGYVFVLVWIHPAKWEKTEDHCFECIKSTFNLVLV